MGGSDQAGDSGGAGGDGADTGDGSGGDDSSGDSGGDDSGGDSGGDDSSGDSGGDDSGGDSGGDDSGGDSGGDDSGGDSGGDDSGGDETYSLPVAVEDQDGNGVSGATLTIDLPSGETMTETVGDNGEILFKEASEGEYTLTATAEGYGTDDKTIQLDSSRDDPVTLTIEEDQETYSIQGTVTNESGEPIDGATVHLKNLRRSTEVRDDGTYEIPNLEPGDYTVIVSADGYKEAEKKVTIKDSDEEDVKMKLKKKDDGDDGGFDWPFMISPGV
ncbi:carboxypeptidase-like regulatory domain-containing protein [Natrinema caseinilyticum]|uniref:carboxypeptidase-like regulatory domain-containing protein n=1 Tax=Natrinema caseinilyticum TaxID=2961570 RepID=UPI0020C2DFF3|nr:carboxypeptidase-like regulatory domain-containing protein [Natrinema caseinilyticum]